MPRAQELQHRLEVTAFERPQTSRDTQIDREFEAKTCSLVGRTERNTTTKDAYPSLGFPNCSLLSIQRRERRHTSLPYTLGYLGLSGDLWARTCSSRLTGSYLTVPHGLDSSEGGRRRAKNPSVYRARHAHGRQDARPLQSVLIRGERDYADILSWPVSNIDVEVDDPPVLLATTLPTRVALSFTGNYWFNSDTYIEVLGATMETLPLDSLITLTVQRQSKFGASLKQFWLRHSPMRRVQLAPYGDCGFAEMLLEDNAGREGPLLPSLTMLVLFGTPLLCISLRDALMKRGEQGVPLETLDLRRCVADERHAEIRLLSEIVVHVLGPETPEKGGRMRTM